MPIDNLFRKISPLTVFFVVAGFDLRKAKVKKGVRGQQQELVC